MRPGSQSSLVSEVSEHSCAMIVQYYLPYPGVLWYSSHKPLGLISCLEHSIIYHGPIFQIETWGSCWSSRVHLYYLCFNMSSCSLKTTRAAYGSGWITPVSSFPLTQSRNFRHKSFSLIWKLSFKWNKNTIWIMTQVLQILFHFQWRPLKLSVKLLMVLQNH